MNESGSGRSIAEIQILECLKDAHSSQYRWVVLHVPISNRNGGGLLSWGILLSPLETVRLQPSSPGTAEQCRYRWFLSKETCFFQKVLRYAGSIRNQVQTRVIPRWLGDVGQAFSYHSLDGCSSATVTTERRWYTVMKCCFYLDRDKSCWAVHNITEVKMFVLLIKNVCPPSSEIKFTLFPFCPSWQMLLVWSIHLRKITWSSNYRWPFYSLISSCIIFIYVIWGCP